MSQDITTNARARLYTIYVLYISCLLMLILLPDIGIWWIVLLPVVLAYRAKKRTAGTIYESHAEWVFLTFAYPFVGGMALTVPLLFIFDKLFSSSETGVIIFLIIGMLFGIWTIYRIIKGCLFMYRKQPIVRPKFLF